MANKSKRSTTIYISLCVFIILGSIFYFQVINKPDVRKLEAEADVLIQQHQLEGAEQRYKEAVTAQQASKELDAHYPELLNKLAAVNQQMGKYENAEKYYNKVIHYPGKNRVRVGSCTETRALRWAPSIFESG